MMAVMAGPPDPRSHLLRSLPGLRGYSERELESLAALVDELEVPAGTVLMREHEAPERSVVIVEGRVAVSIAGEPIAELGPGQFVGEMAMLDPAPRSATVTALTPVRALTVSRAHFEAFVASPGIARHMAAELALRFRQTAAAETSEG
jgi:CRP-like cAMP-binding protein